ncbi:MAG: VirB8/TrbF family protein [Rickettsiaceae bacterium]|nr:VirB8/TrbF family protein [Rickettsiaceae bacterium]
MESRDRPLHEYIKSGDYYADARKWYRYKYIYPFTQRSYILLFCTVISTLFIGTIININHLFPLVKQVQYSIKANSLDNKTAQITRANEVENDPLGSVSNILVKNYVMKREGYDYNSLKKQFTYVKNNSTRLVFRKFYNLMDIDNPNSPVVLYQKSRRLKPSIISIKRLSPSKSIVRFDSGESDVSDENTKKIVKQATIEYEIDKINLNLADGQRFNFTVTDYQLELEKDAKIK